MPVCCPRSPEEGIESLNMELRMFMDHHVGAGNRIRPLQEQEALLMADPFLQNPLVSLFTSCLHCCLVIAGQRLSLSLYYFSLFTSCHIRGGGRDCKD